jgi:kynurenine formamidase
MIYWPTATTTFQHERLAWGPTPGGYFYSSFAVSTPEHGGTHLDAPIHFAEGKESAEAIPLRRLVAPAVVIDVSAKASADRDYRLTVEDVTAFEREHGTIGEGTIVLLRTGFSRHWPDKKAYAPKPRGCLWNNVASPQSAPTSHPLITVRQQISWYTAS